MILDRFTYTHDAEAPTVMEPEAGFVVNRTGWILKYDPDRVEESAKWSKDPNWGL